MAAMPLMEINAGSGGTEAQELGGNSAPYVFRAGGEPKFKVENPRPNRKRTGLIKSRYAANHRRQRLWLVKPNPRHRLVASRLSIPPPGWHTTSPRLSIRWSDDTIEIYSTPPDLKWDTFRLRRPAATREQNGIGFALLHIPTGIIVACQTDRSQHRNRATAMTMLKAGCMKWSCRNVKAASAHHESRQNRYRLGGHQIDPTCWRPTSS